jgi:xylan 1,4-beta-xylosidase
MGAAPILLGFHPDPSICRAGDDYYLINSSFEYFPGVPIFTSRDLRSWKQIGNVLDRETQLNVSPGLSGAGKGIYAPTIRFHDGRFWMTTTNITDVAKGHLIVHSEDPAGPWSDPVYTSGAIGWDPDLSWDEEGHCHLAWADPRGGIAHATVDPLTGQLLSETELIWRGIGLSHPEGPHLFRRNGWCYLLVAEGGTGPGHAVTIGRSRTVTGPYEAHPEGPILTHRSTSHPVQNTGHADLVELQDGGWAIVYLGVRPRGEFPRFHVNGRETFLAGVDWTGDWPVVIPDRHQEPQATTACVDDVAAVVLHPRWIAPGVPPATFCHLDGTGGVTLNAGRRSDDREAKHLLAVRARDAEWQVNVEAAAGDLSLVVRIDDAHWAGIERRGDVLTARAVIGPMDQTLASKNGIPMGAPLALRAVGQPQKHGVRTGPDRVELGYVQGGFRVLAAIDGRYLSTEVAGGFTGRVIGVEALAGHARVDRFEYSAGATEPAATPDF